MENNKKEYYIYKYVYYGAIIYIGQTISLDHRHIQHMNEKQFLELDKNKLKLYYFKVNHSAEMNIWETLLINKYKPVLNRKSKFKNFDERLLSFKEPIWDIYRLENKHSSIKEILVGLRKAKTFGIIDLSTEEENLIEQKINEEISDYLSKQIVINYQDINIYYRVKKIMNLIILDQLPRDITKPELDRILYLTFDEEKVKLDSFQDLHVNIVDDEENYYISVIKKNNPDFKNYWYDFLEKIFDKTDKGVWMKVIDKTLIKKDYNKPMQLRNILPTKREISKN